MVTCDREVPALGAEGDLLKSREVMAEEDVSRRKSRVTTKVHFQRRGEPAERAPLRLRSYKSGFGQVVFGRDGLEKVIVKPLVHDHDGRRVSPEEAARERINLVKREFHLDLSAGQLDIMTAAVGG